MILQFIPLIAVGLIYAVAVFLIARKRRLNSWPWTIATLIPALGLLVALVFLISTLLSVLDRLNAIEASQEERSPL